MKINWDYIKFGLLSVFLVFLFSFSSKRNANRNLIAKEVVFMEDDNFFISLSTVDKLLIQNNEEVTSIGKETLDLNIMERRLDSNPMISKAQVYVTVDGVLGAKIIQRKPMARVASSQSYYIDEDGKAMPLSTEYAARVPLITGNIKEEGNGIKNLLTKIKDDPFMQSRVVGLHIEKNDEIIMYLRVHDFKILFGKPENIDQKFQNFKAFYQKTIKDNTLSTYELVNLKLDSQVVGTKK